MERKRTSTFVALLLLAPLTLALPLMPTNTSATYTSVASQALTYTSASTQTYYASTTGTALVQTPVNLSPKVIGFVAPKGRCSQYSYPVTVVTGAILDLKLTATYPANVYLLPTYAYQTSADGCELTVPAASLLFQANFTSYALRWIAPESGTFYVILTGPTTTIMLTDEGSSQPVKELANVTYPTTTETNYQEYVSTSSTTAILTTTTNQPLYEQPVSSPKLEALAIFGLILCLAASAIAVFRRRP